MHLHAIIDIIKSDGQFFRKTAHLFKKGAERFDLVEEAQRDADESWSKLLKKCGR